MTTNINLYQSVSTCINLYQPVSTCINLYQSVSTCINLYQPVSICIKINMHFFLYIVIYFFDMNERNIRIQRKLHPPLLRFHFHFYCIVVLIIGDLKVCELVIVNIIILIRDVNTGRLVRHSLHLFL